MEELLDQIESSLSENNFLLALFAALSLPDICGALESHNGRANGNRYKAWFNKWVSPKYNGSLNGDQCYAYRCGVLHQGRAVQNNLGYSRIIFLDPSVGPVMHQCKMNDAYNIDVRLFVQDIVASAREWLTSISESKSFEKNYEHFLKRHENGIAPYIVGAPVYG